MRIMIAAAAGLTLAVAASGGWAASKAPTKQHAATAAKKAPGEKAAPSCGALAFRALPTGAAEGDQPAGSYKSRLARLELRGAVKGGAPADYYVMANGARLAAAPAALPEAALSCAAAKKMPKPGAPAQSCTGDRFTLVIAHAASERFALLYGFDAGAWRFCAAGSF